MWRWASVTRQVTAALVLAEVDAGRLALDTSVARYLPDFAGPTARDVLAFDRALVRHRLVSPACRCAT